MKPLYYQLCLATGIAVLLFPSLAARGAFFTTNTTIGVGNTNYDGQDIVVYDCTLTVDGSHVFSDVLLVNNAILTHSFSSNGLLPNPINPGSFVNTGLNLVISNNLVVEAGSAISADGTGLGGGVGGGSGGSLSSDFPYGPPYYYLSGGGGAYGGFGGASYGGAAGGQAYGQVMTPTNSGSGGGVGSGGGGTGGGSIILVVGGDILVDGEITADGENATNSGAGGGAGGGIWLTSQSIEGEGLISANGGAGDALIGGGGGGGRVAIYATTNDLASAAIAQGGVGAVTGGAGTVYTISTNFGNTAYGQVVVNNGGATGTNTEVDVSAPFDLTISGGATVPLSGATLGNLLIASNSWLLGTSSSGIALTLKLNGNATIQASGGIMVDGEGSASQGGGLGAGTLAFINGINTGGGGGYGGYGGNSAGVAQKSGGNSYGSVTQPNQPGSGGGAGTGTGSNDLGGSGGGAMVLTIAGTLQLGGTISANGEPGPGEASGGGSGGSIWITTGNLSGSGTIAANGGSGQLPLGGGGGGGRIAIYPGTNQYTGVILAHGGAGFVAGGAGTIYTDVTGRSASGYAEVVVDNGGLQGTNTSLATLSGNYDLTITNGAVLVPAGSLSGMRNLFIAANSFLTVSQAVTILQFTVTGTATIQPGGGIIVDGEGYTGITSGPGPGGTGVTNGIITGGGGGHGGYGGVSAGGGAAGITYDTLNEASQMGSTGGVGNGTSPYNYGGAGGGLVELTVGGTLNLGGFISANGYPGVGQGSGGGSGGGIRLTVGELTGSGSVSANGGAGESSLGGGGGGGRITITYYTNLFTGSITAQGGPGYAAGGAGTIFLLSELNGIGQLVLNNGGLQGTNTPLSQQFNTSDLTLTNGATAALAPGYSLEIRNLVIASNSFLTLTAPGQTTLALTVISNATIQAGGGIVVDGQGSTAGSSDQGQGGSSVINGVTMGGGGGYGGTGGSSASGVAGGAFTEGYGSFTEPSNVGGAGGNGGGTSPYNVGGTGGGAVRMSVTGTLLVAGRISANGNPGIGQGSGGGAGGSVLLTVGQLTGSGTILANGGAGEPSLGGGGGGGGGRIAIYPGTNLFTGSISAYGGAGFVSGGAGTIYLLTNNNTYAQLTVDNGGSRGAMTLFEPTGNYDLTVANGAILAGESSFALRNLLITSNSAITMASNMYSSPLAITVSSNATIQAGGAIIVDGLSTSSGNQLGSGGSSIINSVTTGGGGAYGGYGGRSGEGVAGGIAYGSIATPEQAGSTGGAGSGTSPNTRGGYGGAAIQMTVTGTLQVAGTLSANGMGGIGQASGGGSGGGIYLIVTGALTGNGMISANGGAGEPSLGGGGGGGGGRIALSLGTNLFTGAISASGGSGAVGGGAGTIYLLTRVPELAQLILNNGGLRGTNTPLQELPQVNNLIITNGAVGVAGQGSFSLQNLLIASNSFLTVSTLTDGSLEMFLTGAATIQAGGGIVVDGGGYSGAQAGPGTGGIFTTNGASAGAGGGYGGNGGASAYGGPGGVSYGSVTEPTQLGSNGGRGNGLTNYGGAGGGMIQLTVVSNLQLGGIISANGLTGVGEGSGGGAGGSIEISVEEGGLSGNGTISANGGSAESNLGGGGGGGRIAVTYISNLFTGSLTAYGGQGFADGGPGTIYTKSNSAQFGQVVLDGGNATGVTTFTALPALGITADLTITGGAKINAASNNRLSVHNLLLNSNAVLSFAGTNGSGAAGMNVLANATIEPGAQIIADGGGFNGNLGPGAGSFGTSTEGDFMGTGGSYGGFGGGTALSGGNAVSYDSILRPVEFGSGGGSVAPYSQSAGGGTVQMTVGGTLDLAGSISANGLTPSSEGCGGGSGGSIQLSALTFIGAGSVSANGGVGFLPNGGGGGGGRVAIYYTSNLFTGAITARGGQGFVGGGAGTIYTRAITNPVGSVIVDNGGLSGTNTLLSAPEAFSLTVSGNAVAQTPVTPSVSDPTLYLGNLLVQSNGVITTASANDNLSLVILSNAVIATNGIISVNGDGYNGAVSGGPGAGLLTNSGDSGSGGGYGGLGGASASGEPGGITYGSSLQPTNWGSQGGLPSASFTNFSSGGGAIRMEVAGALTVNGAVTANGKAAIFPNSGGGAGGSIWLSADSLNGNGAITANGGSGEPGAGGGGGGGRIAIYYLTNNFAGVTTASGATGFLPGQNGSIVASNLSAPQIISQSPTGPVSNAVSSVTLTFSSQLGEFNQFALPLSSDVTITTPSGLLPQGSLSFSGLNVYPQDVTELTVSFPQQTAVGLYTIQVTPPLMDIYGLELATAYTGTFDIAQPTIAGTITDTNDVPIPGVMLQPSGGLASTITDGNGDYSIVVPYGWNGSLSPSLAGYTFIPSAANFTNLVVTTNQNFLAIPPSIFTLTGVAQGTNLSLGWFGESNVTYQVLTSSNLITWQPYGSPISGTNGPISVAIPIGNAPQMFFQYSAVY